MTLPLSLPPPFVVSTADAALALASADESESEAVALACVEMLFAETNACYAQHVAARRTISRVTSALASNIVDAACAAVLREDRVLPASRFVHESSPRPSIADRHAARAAAASPAAVERGALAVALPEIQQLPEEEDEKPELSGAARRASVFSKWATVARAFTPSSTSHKMSLEVEITESTPSLLQKDILGRSSSTSAASTAIRTKSNIDSFSAILDVRAHDQVSDDLFGHQQHTSRSHWSSLDSLHSLHESHAAGSSAKLLPGTAASTSSLVKKKLKGSGAMLLNDKLSRKKNSSSSLGGGGKLWHHESRHTSSSSLGGSTMGVSNGHHAFIPERSDFNAAALPSNIQLSSGVVLTQGESLVEGPARIESPNTMSRKRFDLHQSLATDLLLHWNDHGWMARSVPSSASSPTFHHSHLEHGLKPPYEEVPADPIPTPYLSPIPTSALAIPRTHLASSLSAPVLRVRSPTSKHGNVAPFGQGLSSSASTAALPTRDLQPDPRHRPRTALTIGSSTTSKKSARVGSAAATGKYQREFPKPRPGVVKLSQVDDDGQRLAWISS